jgi:aminoglycoside phosphotransferase (APT) family kinase protein
LTGAARRPYAGTGALATAADSTISGEIPGIESAGLARWFATLPFGARPPLRPALIGQGMSNITVLVSDAQAQRWVVRRPPLGHLLASAHDIPREYRVLSALRDTPVPVPAALALTTDPSHSDAPMMAMEYVPGVVVDDIGIARSLSPALRRAIGLGMVDALSCVHAVDLDRVSLADLASHRPYAARQLKRWTAQWEASRTREQPNVTRLADRLAAAMPVERKVTLLHGDFHLFNVIVDPDDGHTRAIVDWELSTLGEPLADLGMMLASWPAPGDPAGAVLPASEVPGFPTRAELIDAYAKVAGADVADVGFWHVLALWKLAVIMEGIRRRGLDDPRNAERGVRCDAASIDAIVDEAMERAEEAGL